MARPFVVNLGELDEIIADLARFETDAEHVCDDVDRTVTRLHVSWSGEAAKAQHEAHEEWKRGAEELRQAVSDLHTVSQRAHTNYTAAVTANKGMWPA